MEFTIPWNHRWPDPRPWLLDQKSGSRYLLRRYDWSPRILPERLCRTFSPHFEPGDVLLVLQSRQGLQNRSRFLFDPKASDQSLDPTKQVRSLYQRCVLGHGRVGHSESSAFCRVLFLATSCYVYFLYTIINVFNQSRGLVLSKLSFASDWLLYDLRLVKDPPENDRKPRRGRLSGPARPFVASVRFGSSRHG